MYLGFRALRRTCLGVSPPLSATYSHRSLPGRPHCDDFVVMVHGERRHAEVLREEVADVLATLGLRLSPEKTRVVHIDEGFDFLGHNIRRQRKRGTSKYYVYTRPSKKAVQAIKDKVGAKTYRSTRNQDLDQLITSLNQMLALSLIHI